MCLLCRDPHHVNKEGNTFLPESAYLRGVLGEDRAELSSFQVNNDKTMMVMMMMMFVPGNKILQNCYAWARLSLLERTDL
jgi:hypothetical protein